jgi:hypothetical protein
MNIIKGLGQQITLTTANTVVNSVCVYIGAVNAAVITVANTSGTISSFTIPASNYIFVQKNPTDTIAANVAVAATPAAFRG